MTKLDFDLAWQDDALCAQHDLGPLFQDARHAAAAIRWCNVCPVRSECLATAMSLERGFKAGDRSGVWGGFTPAERARLGQRWRYERA